MRAFLGILIGLWQLSTWAQKIDRVEPPFWWAEMHNPTVQIVFYGTNIGSLDVTSDKGIIENIRKTENPNYIFIDFNTSGLTSGKVVFEMSNEGKLLFTQNFELKERASESRYRKGFDSSDVVYLVMSDRFANGDSSNDSHPTVVEKVNRAHKDGRHGGDIQGIINHLDYLEDLGVTALWCTPLLEDNEPTYSYHTYAQSDYYRIDPRFGSNELYKKLADELHQRDMKLIMDYVTNHWGSKHWMIQDLPTRDWIHIWSEGEKGFQRSSYRMSTQMDPHTSDYDYKACMDGWFDTTMPDMNQANPLLLKYLITNAIWWIEYADLDGYRVDTYSYNDKEGIAQWTKAILDEYPYFNIVGEVWMEETARVAYWQKDSAIGALQDYNSYCPSVMDFTLFFEMAKMFNEDEQHWQDGMYRAYNNFVNDFLYPDPMNLMIFAGNHDTSRIASVFGENVDKYKLVLTLLATMRGYPQLYYGDEIGMTGLKNEGDGLLRKDFPGGWKGDQQNAFTQSGLSEKQLDYYTFTKKLLNWRKQATVIHRGKLKQFVPQNNVYVYFRYTDSESVMVIINNSLNEQTIDWTRFSEMLKGYNNGVDIISGKKIKVGKPLIISGKTSMIIPLES
jgi:glycosidase